MREEHTSGKIVEIIEELGLSWERVGEYGIITRIFPVKAGEDRIAPCGYGCPACG